MNQEVANAVSGYIETLYRMNQKCILLCGADLVNGPDYTVPTLELVCDIPRVVPYKYSEEKGILMSYISIMIRSTKQAIPTRQKYSTLAMTRFRNSRTWCGSS